MGERAEYSACERWNLAGPYYSFTIHRENSTLPESLTTEPSIYYKIVDDGTRRRGLFVVVRLPKRGDDRLMKQRIATPNQYHFFQLLLLFDSHHHD